VIIRKVSYRKDDSASTVRCAQYMSALKISGSPRLRPQLLFKNYRKAVAENDRVRDRVSGSGYWLDNRKGICL